MIKVTGGTKVGKGNYWNISNGDRLIIKTETTLPGNTDTVYLKLNPLFVLAMAPMLGLVYAAFLPFIGMAMLVKVIFQKMGSVVSDRVIANGSFVWQPTESYLAYKQKHESKDASSKDTIDKS